jgi:hypothetical protein
MWVDILVVAVSLIGSFLISMYTVNSRIDKERGREIERWYVDAGVQADLARKEYSNEVLSENSTGNDTVEVLRARADELQQHAAEGRYLGVDESIWSALRDIGMNYRWGTCPATRRRRDGGLGRSHGVAYDAAESRRRASRTRLR